MNKEPSGVPRGVNTAQKTCVFILDPVSIRQSALAYAAVPSTFSLLKNTREEGTG